MQIISLRKLLAKPRPTFPVLHQSHAAIFYLLVLKAFTALLRVDPSKIFHSFNCQFSQLRHF